MLTHPHGKEKLLNLVSRHLQQRPEILFAFAHGSFIGEGPFRDLDIAVFLEPGFIQSIDFRYEMQLESGIERDLE